MSFGGLILTNKGRNLQVKAQTGVALNYSKVKIGDGEIGSSSILDMNDLKNTLHVLDISNIRRNGNQVTIRTIVTNKELQEGFYFREIGVFAEDPDEGEILYCYANARSNAEYIPAAGTDIVEKNIDVVVIVGQAENVTATIDESLIFASKKDVESKVSKVEGKGLSDENYSTDEKDKLAGIEEGAEVNRGISDSIASDSSVTAASSKAVKLVNDKVNNRVVKVNGKGLSSEDYSSGEKDKLAGIEEGAQVNREISDRVDLDSSSIVASSKAVRVVSSSLADIANKQGDLSTLQTTEKTNLVGAMNELFQSGNNVKNNTVDTLLSVDNNLPLTHNSEWTDILSQIGNISTGVKIVKGEANTGTTGYYFKADDGSNKFDYGIAIDMSLLEFIPDKIVVTAKNKTSRFSVWLKDNFYYYSSTRYANCNVNGSRFRVPYIKGNVIIPIGGTNILCEYTIYGGEE